MIGVNKFVEANERAHIELHPYDTSTADRQIARTRTVRAKRDETENTRLLEQLIAVAKDETQNVMPGTSDLVRAGATMGDIVETLRDLGGTYRENPVF